MTRNTRRSRTAHQDGGKAYQSTDNELDWVPWALLWMVAWLIVFMIGLVTNNVVVELLGFSLSVGLFLGGILLAFLGCGVIAIVCMIGEAVGNWKSRRRA